MIIKSDWHIHTECSYDATLTYAEFLREQFEMGIPVTYGSDSHKERN